MSMSEGGLFSTYSFFSDAAGVADQRLGELSEAGQQSNFRVALHLCPLELLNMPLIKMLGLLLAVFSVFAVVVFVSIRVFEPPQRQLFVGYLSVFSLISMFASPLFIINLVIRTKSVEYMPFYLSLATFLMSLSFFAYGMLKKDGFISKLCASVEKAVTRVICMMDTALHRTGRATNL
ncbi:UNVERIFIED_CONTAM: Bidirectional sugar transporter SWEET2a [Sesamum latifolium]|uniref:Bidirectional sugar transporter SWEET2a n=1 Tax=Sesamum latifolium TaxID=2727402 RepID=A0AAW2WMI0_9LAMI